MPNTSKTHHSHDSPATRGIRSPLPTMPHHDSSTLPMNHCHLERSWIVIFSPFSPAYNLAMHTSFFSYSSPELQPLLMPPPTLMTLPTPYSILQPHASLPSTRPLPVPTAWQINSSPISSCTLLVPTCVSPGTFQRTCPCFLLLPYPTLWSGHL